MTNGSPQPHLTEQDRVKGIHITYCQESGNAISLTLHRMMIWQAWLRHGWTSEDLKATIRYIRKRYYNRDRPQIVAGMIRFSRLVEQPETFEEYLCDACADARNAPKPPTQRDSVLKAAGRVEPEGNGEIKTPAHVLENGYAALKKQLENL